MSPPHSPQSTRSTFSPRSRRCGADQAVCCSATDARARAHTHTASYGNAGCALNARPQPTSDILSWWSGAEQRRCDIWWVAGWAEKWRRQEEEEEAGEDDDDDETMSRGAREESVPISSNVRSQGTGSERVREVFTTRWTRARAGQPATRSASGVALLCLGGGGGGGEQRTEIRVCHNQGWTARKLPVRTDHGRILAGWMPCTGQ